MISFSNGKIRNAEDVQFADKILQLKHEKGPWDVIEELVKAWQKKSPEEFNAYKIYIEDTKNAQIDNKFGTTKSKDQDRRLLLVFPQPLMAMIRSVYPVDELQMDRSFYNEFGRRFKFFQIPEKT